VVHSVNIKYLQSAVLDDEIIATAELINVSKTSFTVSQTILRENDLLVDARVKIVCIRHDKKSPCAIPSDMLKKLQLASVSIEETN
jgi:YbgC/YbaW family acyl-CoA thioester hydrolase